MKRWLAALLMAVVLSMGIGFAEDVWHDDPAVAADELIGLWQIKNDSSLDLMILPGAYAPQSNEAEPVDLYVEAYWLEDEDWIIKYALGLHKGGHSESIFGSSLLGSALELLMQSIQEQTEGFQGHVFSYRNGKIGARFTDEPIDGQEDMNSYYLYSDSVSGYFWAQHEEDGSLTLYWLDNYDPHAYVSLKRVTAAPPDADAISQDLIPPLLKQPTDEEAALAMRAFAVSYKLYRVESAPLSRSIREGIEALPREDREKVVQRLHLLSPALWEAIGHTQGNTSIIEQFMPSEQKELADSLSSTLEQPLDKYSVDILCSAVNALFASEPSKN